MGPGRAAGSCLEFGDPILLTIPTTPRTWLSTLQQVGRRSSAPRPGEVAMRDAEGFVDRLAAIVGARNVIGPEGDLAP